MEEIKFCSECKNYDVLPEEHPCDECFGTKDKPHWKISSTDNEICTFDEYQQATARTDNHKNQPQALINFGLGIGGEAGEVQDIIKKHLYHGHLLDKEKIKYELGDVLWYIARIARWADLTLEEVAQANIDKLKQRYPDGFSQEKSINREDK